MRIFSPLRLTIPRFSQLYIIPEVITHAFCSTQTPHPA